MEKADVRRGQKVLVTHPDSEHRDDSEAKILKTPPWSENVAGTSVTHEDRVLVEYPGTSMGSMFTDMREAIPISNLEEL